MPTLPGAVLPWIESRFLDPNGNILAGGYLYFYIAGTSTPKLVYQDSSLSIPHAQPVTLDAYGRAKVYLASGGYKVIVQDSLGVQQYSFDNVEDVGLTWLSVWGVTLATGSLDVASGYQVVSTDQLVTVDSTGGADPCVVVLEAAADRGLPLTIKNLGDVDVAITPQAGETIDGVAGVYTLAAGASPTFPSVHLVSDGVSGWYILASHG